MDYSINDVLKDIESLKYSMNEILTKSNFEGDEYLSYVSYDKKDKEDLYKLDIARDILAKLDAIVHDINYLNRPVKTEGELELNENGRYEVNGVELTCGRGVEYLCTDDYHATYDDGAKDYICVPYWKASRIEHNGEQYYLVGASELESLDSVHVRIR